MKDIMMFTKSPVGKLHASIAVFVLINLLSGIVNYFIHYMPWLVTAHFYSGLLIFIAPLIMLIVSKNRGMLFKAFRKMILPVKPDFRKGKPVITVFKVVTALTILLILASALGGIFVKFQLLLPAVSYDIHIFNFKVLLALVPLHAISAYRMRRARIKRK